MIARRTDLLRLRRLAHGLDGEPSATPAAVVDRMLAVQAQDFGAACWALAVRTAGATRSQVLADLDAGRIIRSWPMRGTLHFVPPADLRWMLAITTDRMVQGLGRRQQQLGLTAADFARASDIAVGALEGGRSIGRAELMAVWEAAGIATTGQRGYHLIYFLAQTGLLCWGPTHRTQQALVLLDEWVPQHRELAREEALAEYLRRYLAGHGPATLQDFVWWTKGTVADARTAVAVLGDELTTLTVDGVDHLVTAELADRAAETPATRGEQAAVHLLPAFDEYLLGYRDRSAVLDEERFDAVVPGGNGVFAPILVVKGRVAGLWRRSGAEVTAQPFEPLTAAQQRAVARAATAYRRFAAQ